MKLRIEFNNPSHRFISKMTITVTADGTTLTKLPASKPGALLFDVPDTATDISIKAEIPHPTGGTPKILDTTQNYKKKSTSGGSPILTPQSPINQRFTVTGWLGVTKKSAGVFLLKLDLTFLDLTAYAAGLPSSNQFTYSPSHGCAFAVLECTDDYFDRKGDEAITWAVLIPPAIVNTPSPTAINALLFLRPTIPLKNPTLRIHAYTNTDDVRNVTFRFTRYMNDPSASEPFYVIGGGFFPTPLCGWEKQLADAGKPVVLFWPFPQGNNHGSALSSRMPSLIRSALLTLFVNGRLNKPSLFAEYKLGLSGFSAGGEKALDTLGQPGNGSQVDELYLFEPAGFSKRVSEVEKWFKMGGKKLRLIAGGYHQQSMITLANTLANPADATCSPNDPDYWFSSSLYKAAVSKPGRTERFDPVGTTPTPDFATDISGIFVKTYNVTTKQFTLSWTQASPSKIFEKTFADTVPSQEEAASLVRWFLIDFYLTGAKVSKLADFNTIFFRINKNEDPDPEPNRIGSIRHEWTVVGGEGAADRQAGFKGFLQLCLEKSGF